MTGRDTATLSGGDGLLSAETHSILMKCGTIRAYEPDVPLFVEGDSSDFVTLVHTGILKVTNTSENGYVCLLALRGPGNLLGEFGVLEDRPRSATVTPVTPLTATVIAAARFTDTLRVHPPIALELLRTLVRRVREGDRRRLEFGAYAATDRIARILLDMANEHGQPVRGQPAVRVVTTYQHDIAAAAGTSRESVARAVRELSQLGVISSRRGHLTVAMDLMAALVKQKTADGCVSSDMYEARRPD